MQKFTIEREADFQAMHVVTSCCILIFLTAAQKALSVPLTVVPDKSGEQQVKEALKKAENEAEKAAKETKYKEPKESKSEGTQSRSIDSKNEARNTPFSDSVESHQESSNKRMKEMAAKLNSLVVKFQRKVIANKLHNALQRRVAQTRSGKKSFQGQPSGRQKTNSFDLSSLDPLAGANNGMASPYKEDTKLEDRLAMEAEEEKKFNNGETYDEDGGYHDSPVKNYAGTTSLSPKEQASQEMQRYNALISSESSRELTQIQDEISKATQSSMGKVSVQGENPSVTADQQSNNGASQNLDLGGLGGLGSQNSEALAGNMGGLGSLEASSPGTNIGNQFDSAGLNSLSGGQGENFAGSVESPGDIQLQTQDTQNMQSLIGAGAGAQALSLNPQSVEADITGSQHLFNKKSNISSIKKKTHKSIKGGQKRSREN